MVNSRIFPGCTSGKSYFLCAELNSMNIQLVSLHYYRVGLHHMVAIDCLYLLLIRSSEGKSEVIFKFLRIHLISSFAFNANPGVPMLTVVPMLIHCRC